MKALTLAAVLVAVTLQIVTLMLPSISICTPTATGQLHCVKR